MLAHDVHPLDVTGEDAPDDLHHGETRLVIELLDGYAPRLGKAFSRFGIIDPLIIRIHHWDEPSVRSALHIVLAAKRMQPGSGPADLSRHQCQGNETARIVGAVDMLTDAHSPQNHGA